jgi:hypothetical protein
MGSSVLAPLPRNLFNFGVCRRRAGLTRHFLRLPRGTPNANFSSEVIFSTSWPARERDDRICYITRQSRYILFCSARAFCLGDRSGAKVPLGWGVGGAWACVLLRSEAGDHLFACFAAFHNQAERVASNVDLNQLARGGGRRRCFWSGAVRIGASSAIASFNYTLCAD